jgi:hypothetical protein
MYTCAPTRPRRDERPGCRYSCAEAWTYWGDGLLCTGWGVRFGGKCSLQQFLLQRSHLERSEADPDSGRDSLNAAETLESKRFTLKALLRYAQGASLFRRLSESLKMTSPL